MTFTLLQLHLQLQSVGRVHIIIGPAVCVGVGPAASRSHESGVHWVSSIAWVRLQCAFGSRGQPRSAFVCSTVGEWRVSLRIGLVGLLHSYSNSVFDWQVIFICLFEKVIDVDSVFQIVCYWDVSSLPPGDVHVIRSPDRFIRLQGMVVPYDGLHRIEFHIAIFTRKSGVCVFV